MNAADERGHTAMCEFLRAQRCPWGIWSAEIAAIGGHIDCLRWLLDNGCLWDACELCEWAIQGGRVDVLAYLQQRGILTSTAMLTDMLHVAGRYNKLAAAQWLRGAGAEWPTAVALRSWRGEAHAWAAAEVNATLVLQQGTHCTDICSTLTQHITMV
jgi:hypothetical protein